MRSLVQRWIPCITLTAAAALDTGTTGIAVFAEVVAASAGGIGEVRPRNRVSVGALERDRLAAAHDFGGAKDMAQVGLSETGRFDVIKYLMPFSQGKDRATATTFLGPMGFHVRTDRHRRQNDLLIEVLEKSLENRISRVTHA